MRHLKNEISTHNKTYDAIRKEKQMAKKGLLVLVLVSALTGGIFAQEAAWGGKKNFVSADLGLLVAGLRYERLLAPKLSVGVDAYWANSFIIFNELQAGAFARYYLFGGFYGELGLGFNIHSGLEDLDYEFFGRTVTANGLVTTTGFAISPGIGWKFDPGKPGGFFLEPGISVPITIGERSYWLGAIESETGVSTGFVLYLGLGAAF
jgi:hypothetical protein